jgi:hypothetical protein
MKRKESAVISETQFRLVQVGQPTFWARLAVHQLLAVSLVKRLGFVRSEALVFRYMFDKGIYVFCRQVVSWPLLLHALGWQGPG